MMLAAALGLSAAGLSAAPLAPIPADARQELAAFARKVLSGEVTAVSNEELQKMPPCLRQPAAEELFVTIFRDRAPGIRFTAQKTGLVEATFAAMGKARTLPSFEFYGFADARGVSLLFERVVDRRPIAPARWVGDLAFLELGVEGISIRQDPTPAKDAEGKMVLVPARGGAMPPSEVFLQGFDTRDDFVNRLCFQLAVFYKLPHMMPAGALRWDKNLTHVDRLAFETFVSREGADAPVELFRMNDLAVAPWKDSAAAARRVGDELARYQLPDGRFFSRFESRMGRFVHVNVGVVDHAMACLALTDLAAATEGAGRTKYLAAAERGLMHLRLYFTRQKDKQGRPILFLVQDQEAKLGAAALAALAIERVASLTGSAASDDDLKQLGRFLVTQQDDDGSFRHFYRYDAKAPWNYRLVQGYPGQAVWALAVLDKRFGGKEFGAAARKGADYLVTKRDAEMHWTEAPTDPWLAAGLRELSTPFAEPRYVAYARRMADSTLARQNVKDVAPDVLGSFRGDKEGSTAGTALATTLLGETIDFTAPTPASQAAGTEAMRRAVAFLRLNEVRPNNTFFLVNAERAYGFIRSGLFDTDVDLETTAGAIEALLWTDRVEKMK